MTLIITELDEMSTVFVFRDHDLLIEYLEWQKENIALDVGNLIRSAIPYDRWDHYTPTCAKTIHSLALMKIMFGKSAPLYAHTAALQEYAQSLFNAFDRTAKTGEILVVNMNGGYQTVSPLRLSDETPYAIDAPDRVHLVDDSVALILENDPVLDPWTVENVKFKYSYVTELRKFSDDQLQRAMWDFLNTIHGNGDRILFVYTTGLDGPQMQRYVRIALGCSFNKFIFVQSGDDEMSFHIAKRTIEEAKRTCMIFDQNDDELKGYLK